MTHFLTKAYQYTTIYNYITPDNILKMTAQQKAEELIEQFRNILMDSDSDCGNEILCTLLAKQCAKVAVRNIISANPHSNPFNTEMNSTFDWWFEVYNLLSE